MMVPWEGKNLPVYFSIIFLNVGLLAMDKVILHAINIFVRSKLESDLMYSSLT
uniref:Uncharacterized protein n=1 Tax=Lepeophtheirus salmonis TaxID=72036 RepID=A0A0K2V5P3_LEPSM